MKHWEIQTSTANFGGDNLKKSTQVMVDYYIENEDEAIGYIDDILCFYENGIIKELSNKTCQNIQSRVEIEIEEGRQSVVEVVEGQRDIESSYYMNS